MIIAHAIQKDPSILEYAKTWNDNKKIIRMAIEKDPFAIRHASDKQKSDPELLMVAI